MLAGAVSVGMQMPHSSHRLAVDNAGHLSDKDKSSLLEYPLHRVGKKFPAIRQSSVLSRVHVSEQECADPLVELSDCSGHTDTAQHTSSQGLSYDIDERRRSDEELEQPNAKRVKLAKKSIDVSGSGEKDEKREGDSVEEDSVQHDGYSSQEAEETREVSWAMHVCGVVYNGSSLQRRGKRRQEREARYRAAESLLEMRNMDG